jgi:hypothetical protein
MTKKYRFETLEELQQSYPIHSVFSKRIEHHIDAHTYYNTSDLKVLKVRSDKIEIVDEATCITYKTVINARIVEGYLYDGEYWYPATIGHDGWDTLDEYDIFKEEEIIYDCAKHILRYP